MNINKHKLEGDSISFQQSPNTSGRFGENLPDTIVIHFTAGSSAASSANWLCNPKANASAHAVVGKKGEIIQLVPFDTIAWHAGKSSWGSRTGLNKYSIGIELDNPGRLEKRVNGYYTYFGASIDESMVVEAVHQNEDEASYWCAYSEAQIIAVRQLCFQLAQVYPIHTIVGHEEISPGRKTDPGPAFPLDLVRSQVLDNNRQSDEPSEYDVSSADGMVNADLLNIRSAPSINAYKVDEPLTKGTLVKILASKGEWHKVRVITEGWVSKKYIKS